MPGEEIGIMPGEEIGIMPGEEIEVLNAFDAAKTQLYHFTAIVIAGMGFFTDAYDLFSISLVTKILARIYYQENGAEKPGSLLPNMAAAVNGVAFCGTLAGQPFFRWLGDKLGRKKVYGMTLMLMVTASIASGLSFGDHPKAVVATHCFFRLWLGFGIGGDYPLSATIMSEYANKKTRWAFIAAVFAMQGLRFVAMYPLTFFFANFGPNAATFVVPAKIFLARLKSACRGISASAGKAGAIVTAFGFLYVAQPTDPKKIDAGYPPGIGVRNSLVVLGCVNFHVMLFTFLVPESKGKSLEEMSRDNEEEDGSVTELRVQGGNDFGTVPV